MFKYIRTGRQPMVGQLLRAISSGSRIYQVVEVDEVNKRVRLQWYASTNKGQTLYHKGKRTRWQPHHYEEPTATPRGRWVNGSVIPTRGHWHRGGYWSCQWYRPVEEVRV